MRMETLFQRMRKQMEEILLSRHVPIDFQWDNQTFPPVSEILKY